MGMFSKGDAEEEAIRRRVRIERSEHKRREELERFLGYAIPAALLVGACAVTKVLMLLGLVE